MSEVRESVEIVNNRGLHARASAKFVNARSIAAHVSAVDAIVVK